MTETGHTAVMATTEARPAGRLLTADDPDVDLCTAVPGTEHDYRPHTYRRYGAPHTSLVCVWCRAVACGDASDPDPCIEPYHHKVDHRTRSGATWKIGGLRPVRPRG